ncbi:hypothetical protein QJQ58_15740 [Paenibacillus dendritiformis]|uniref:hypothetical protein n=1 Tax=Paenibacillus dendritiformis TaxID=130049 RepID=UPI00248CDF70|nr:hypothetical protein [Paenibacillus dendritiformis]WGU92064.1 hypothetical protein QJQ58_15740 [Paenibacillus dendritiformis]
MKQWKETKALLEKYNNNKEFILVELGVKKVNPKLIVGLSRELDDGRVSSLRKSIESSGWKDIHPSSMHMVKLPTGEYLVCNGGNHRAFLSRELGIQEIKAQVSTFLNVSSLSDIELNKLREFEKEIDDLHNQLHKNKDEIKLSEDITCKEQERNEYLCSIYQSLDNSFITH